MARKAYVNNAPDMRNAHMNNALAEVLDAEVARIALKKKKLTTNQEHWNQSFYWHC